MDLQTFEIRRVREWTDPHGRSEIAPCGWTDPRPAPGHIPGPAFWALYGRDSEGVAVHIADLKTRARAVALGEALAAGRPVHRLDSMLPGFRVTWETVTEESAETGDAAERGFVSRAWAWHSLAFAHAGAQVGAYDMPLRSAVQFMAEPGNFCELETVEPDDSDATRARSIRATYSRRDGAPEIGASLTLHLPETLTGASRARLVALLTGRPRKAPQAAQETPQAAPEAFDALTIAEAAACLWEAALEAHRDLFPRADCPAWVQDMQRHVDACGWSGLRLTLCQHVETLERGYRAAVAEGFDSPFDWDFCPWFLAACFDWDNGPALAPDWLGRCREIGRADRMAGGAAIRALGAINTGEESD